MYLLIDLSSNMLMSWYRDMMNAYHAADALEADGRPILVRYDAGFRG
jgi:hypothetical protein